MADWLAPVRERYLELREDPDRIEDFLEAGAEKARAIASGVVADVREAMGVGPCPPGRHRLRARPSVEPSPSLLLLRIAQLELDLDVFAGPFDLLLSLVLREELDLLEVDLAEVVVAYLDHLEAGEELDLEAATEFLVLIAALLELKSRLMLPGEDVEELDELEPAEAAEELVERMLQYARFRAAGAFLAERHDHGQGFLFRSARLPESLRQVPLARPPRPTTRACSARRWAALLRTPPPIDLTHMAVPRVTRGRARRPPARAAAPRHVLVRRGGQGRRPRDRLRHRVRAARAVQARRGRVGAGRAVRRDHRARDRRPRRRRRERSRSSPASRRCSSSPPSPSRPRSWPTRSRSPSPPWSARSTRWRTMLEGRGVVLRRVAGGVALASHPDAEEAARRLLARPRTPALTPAQAETLAIVAYLQPVSRPEVARIRGVASESATAALVERGLIEEAGRSQFGAVLYRTTALFLSCSAWTRRSSCPTSRSGTRARRRPPRCATACCGSRARPARRPAAAGRAGPARRRSAAPRMATIAPSDDGASGMWMTSSSSIFAPTNTSRAARP